MSTAASLQNLAAKPKDLSKSTHAGLLVQRKCACGLPVSSCERFQGVAALVGRHAPGNQSVPWRLGGGRANVTGLSASPKLIKGGLVLIDADTARVPRIISLQYNANSLTRKLQAQEAGGESGNRTGETGRSELMMVWQLHCEARTPTSDVCKTTKERDGFRRTPLGAVK